MLMGKQLLIALQKNSPAEKAGLQEGDIVFGINNSFSDKFADYKEALFAARDKLKVSIFRNNQIKTIVVAIESIL
jgi:predicted metalloprotease with PDZ domain